MTVLIAVLVQVL